MTYTCKRVGRVVFKDRGKRKGTAQTTVHVIRKVENVVVRVDFGFISKDEFV